jgi:hypothetical protein
MGRPGFSLIFSARKGTVGGMTQPRNAEPYQPNCKCGAAWWGVVMCHCAACHLTFTNIRAFDAHRHDGGCLSPGQCKPALTEVRPGVYGRSQSDPRPRQGASE